MNYWLHRIKHHADISYPLLNNNLLSIGFSDFSRQEFIDNVLDGETWEKRWKKLEKEFDNTWGSRPRTRHNLWRFIEGFRKGDRIVVPSWGVFSVYEIDDEKPLPINRIDTQNLKDWHGNKLELKDGLIHRNEQSIDLGFVWRVKPIALKIPRDGYADAKLTSRMKIRNTNSLITKLKKSVETSIEAFKNNKPINLHSEIIDKNAKQTLEILRSKLNPNRFEKVVKWYFNRIGATEVYIPPKNERNKSGDADVIAVFEAIKTIIYTQVKFHQGDTSSWAVQQILDYKNKQEEMSESENDVMDDEYSRISWVISSADGYTERCFKLAKEEKVQLIDGLKFSQMLLEAGILNINKAF